MKEKITNSLNALYKLLKNILSILLTGLAFIGLLSLFFFLFLQILQDVRIDETVYDSFFNVSFYNLLTNSYMSFFIVFVIHIISVTVLHLLYKMTNFNTIKLQAYCWKLYIPLWITLWLTMSLDEIGFTIITSVISFLALLSPLIKTPKLVSSSESEVYAEEESK